MSVYIFGQNMKMKFKCKFSVLHCEPKIDCCGLHIKPIFCIFVEEKELFWDIYNLPTKPKLCSDCLGRA